MAAKSKRTAKPKEAPKPRRSPKPKPTPVVPKGQVVLVEDDKQLAAYINAEHGAAQQAGRTSVDLALIFLAHARNAGEALLRAKEAVGHGSFVPWVRENCACDIRTAQRYMDKAKEAREAVDRARNDELKYDRVSYFDPDKVIGFVSTATTPDSSATTADEAEATLQGQSGEQEAAPAPDQGQEGVAPSPAASEGVEGGQDSPGGGDGGTDGQNEDEPAADAPPEPTSEGAAEPVPPDEVPKGKRYPHSERLKVWLGHVQGTTFTVRMELGGIGSMLAERDKWDWRDVRTAILPMLEDLIPVLEEFRTEIKNATQQQ